MNPAFAQLHIVAPMGLEDSGLTLAAERYRPALRGVAASVVTTIVSPSRRREHVADRHVERMADLRRSISAGSDVVTFWLGLHPDDVGLQRQLDVMADLREAGTTNVVLAERTGRPEREAYDDVLAKDGVLSGIVVMNARHAETWRAWAPGLPIVVAPPPLPEDLFFAERIGASPVTVLFIGRFDHRKGADRLPRVWRSLRSRELDARLVIAGQEFEGSADIEQALVDLADADPAVQLVRGMTAEVRRLLISRAHIGVSVARQEFDGIAVSEMLAGGLPVVATDTVGSVALSDESRALRVAVDEAQLVELIGQLVVDGSLRARLAVEAKESMRGARSVESVRGRLMPFFLGLR